MRSPTPPLKVTDPQREVLETLSRSQTAAHRDVQRAKALLMASDGFATTRIAKEIGVSPATVTRWRERFEQKLADVVGLYLNPPERAIVLSMDEKSQIQALDRTQPSLPIKPGRAGTMTHDYKRNGTTTLFAALNVLTGSVIGQCLPRHRHSEFLTFLRTIDRTVPKGLQIHLILDNYATHTHPNVKAWLAKHPRFHLHFTPTSSSWVNMVESFFSQLTNKAIRRGVFTSVPDLIAAIDTYLTTVSYTHLTLPTILRV